MLFLDDKTFIRKLVKLAKTLVAIHVSGVAMDQKMV